ncbi:MAG: exodeoxyribonuclease VII small subunit [Ruminococcaceae bacterium]|nr:exodeoxyribonuclease VII small subunit [Oscillospiraceae bacterium]
MAKKELKFEEALGRLEEILNRLESGEGDLEALLRDYEEGIALVRICNERLECAEQTVKMLQFTPEGGVTAVNFGEEETEES